LRSPVIFHKLVRFVESFRLLYFFQPVNSKVGNNDNKPSRRNNRKKFVQKSSFERPGVRKEQKCVVFVVNQIFISVKNVICKKMFFKRINFKDKILGEIFFVSGARVGFEQF